MYLNELYDKVKEIFQDYYEIEVKKKDEDRIRISIKKEDIEVAVLFKISNNFNIIEAKTVYNNIVIPELPCWFKNKQIELMDLITKYKKDFKMHVCIKESELEFFKKLKEYKPIFIGDGIERIEDTQEFKDKHKHQPNTNNVKPNHYKLNIKGQDIEVMDIIDAVVKDMDGRKGYIVGNILKYVCRAEKKNRLEDYKKARTYLDMLIGGSDTTNEIPQELENERFFNSGTFRENNIVRAEKVIKDKLKKNIDDLKPLTRGR